MYWIFFALFIFGVLVPDIIRGDIGFLGEERVEEVVIFLLGALGFLIFLFKEKELLSEKEEKEKSQKRLDETGKDLIESYSYIGEVNRKIDMLMGITLGISDREIFDKNKEKETLSSIANAAKLLLRGENAALIFLDCEKGNIEERLDTNDLVNKIRKEDLEGVGGIVNVKKNKEYIIISSPNKMNEVRSYLCIEDYAEEEEKKPKNIEILKVLASQALFVYSFSRRNSKDDCKC